MRVYITEHRWMNDWMNGDYPEMAFCGRPEGHSPPCRSAEAYAHIKKLTSEAKRRKR